LVSFWVNFRPFSPTARRSQVGGKADLTQERATFSSECRELGANGPVSRALGRGANSQGLSFEHSLGNVDFLVRDR